MSDEAPEPNHANNSELDAAPRRGGLNLRTQVAMLLALATLPVGVLAVAQGFAAYRETQSLRLAGIARDSVQASRAERGALIEAFGSITALDPQVNFDAPRGECNDALKAYVNTSERASFAGVFGRDGGLHCGHPFSEQLNVSQTAEFKKFLDAPRRTVTAYERGPISGVPVLAVSAPIYRDGELVGSLAISLPSYYLKWVAGTGPKDPSARYAIFSGDGLKVANTGASTEELWLPSDMGGVLSLLADEEPVVLATESGERRIFSATPLFEQDVFAVASWPESRLSQAPSIVQFATLFLPLVMWMLAVGVAYYAVDRFALRHVLYLDRLVRAYGGTGRKLRAKGVRAAPREFAQLGASFDEMASEIENREALLRRNLDEKNVLLKEVYHRVKNNLQLIVSLINMQLRDVEHEHERDGLTRLQDRVYGLAMVHQKLYEAEGLDAVRVDALIREIADNARGARGPEAGSFILEYDLIEHEEPPERALPICLFSAEAIANAFKHALEFGKGGWLSISLQQEGENLVLEISNGRCEKAIENEGAPGLGSQLIDGFVNQLRGTLERDVCDEYYTLRLSFPASSGVEQAQPSPRAQIAV